VTCFVVGRNEMARLPWFLTHHRGIGVRHFHYIDNSSTDGSIGYLSSQPDVTLHPQPAKYGPVNGYGKEWQMAIIREHGMGQWCLALDVDEALVLPLKTLPEQTAFMEAEGATMMKVNMVDAYPEGDIQEASPYDCFWHDRPYSDEELKARKLSSSQRLARLRHRAFGLTDSNMAKSVLFRMDASVKSSGGFHHLTGDVRRSQHVGMLCHAKYIGSFPAYVHESVQRGVHWNESEEYRCYQRGLSESMVLYDQRWSSMMEFQNMMELGIMSQEGVVLGEGGHVFADHLCYGRDGVEKNESRAVELWAQEAELGNEQCIKNMVWAYTSGIGVSPDEARAQMWQRRLSG
jgi:hypothetical protein